MSKLITELTPQQRTYLVFAVLGTLIPWAFFAIFIANNGFDIPLFARSLFVNGAAGGFSADLLLSSFLFWIWSFQDAQKHGVRHWWSVIPAGLFVGLSLALPLYLLLSTKTRAVPQA